ncbi:DUF4349 domain-containing protein [Effusibacillus lacus]|nr:DUF4349 domain-containing protein [Effusibacillus lacus]
MEPKPVAKGAKLEEILQVEKELTRVRSEIEWAQGGRKSSRTKVSQIQ